jgi:restriction system protein
MNKNNFYILSFLTILWFFLFFYYKKYKKPRYKHIYYIKQADVVLSTINSFSYPGQKLNYLRKINPFIFEELLLTAFQKKGYKIKRNKKYTGDGGIDGIIFNNKNKILIQAKRYSNYINPKHLKEFEILVLKNKCKGYFIHTGKTSTDIYKENQNNLNISIISGNKLLNLLT